MKKEEYEKAMIERCINEMNFKKEFDLEVLPIYGNKITLDCINYFDEITGIKIIFHNIEIASYDLNTKNITYLCRHRNIVVMKKITKILNDFTKDEKYRINSKKLQKFYEFAETLDENLTEYECAELFSMN